MCASLKMLETLFFKIVRVQTKLSLAEQKNETSVQYFLPETKDYRSFSKFVASPIWCYVTPILEVSTIAFSAFYVGRKIKRKQGC